MKRFHCVLLVTLALGGFTLTKAQTPVFINEIHYDNSSTDTGEAVEVAGPAGTDLTGWSIALYNGSASQLNVYNTINLSGTISDQGSGFGTLAFSQAGIQNGAPDGLALVDNSSTVIQFLSYEGTFTAATGPASGLTSVDIGVSESSSTPVGFSLQLSGTGSTYEDFTWNAPATNTFGAVNIGQSFTGGGPATNVLINEVDSDTPGSDNMEFVELYDGGSGNTALDGLVVVFFNGSDDASYEAFDLDGFSTDANGFFVLGNPGVANVDLVFNPGSFGALQNGADAVALFTGDASAFPNDTPVTTTNLIDAIVYDTNDSDDTGLLVLLNASQPQVNEDGAGDKDNHSNSRVPDGGTQKNTDTYVQQTPTPGATNILPPQAPPVVINEVDSDTPGSDNMEFVELYDGGIGNTALDGLVVVFFNGSDDASYESFDLDGFTTSSDGFFVLGNPSVANVDLVFNPGSFGALQNGADAVALFTGDASDFPNDTPVTTTNLIDAIVYDTNDGDDTGLLVLLNASQPQVNEDGAGDKDNHSNSRVPDGGTPRDTDTYVQQAPTPGASNIIPPDVVINEVDADTPGSDVLEFVELYDGGAGNTDLTGLVVVFFNGSDDASYAAHDLDGFSTDANGFFLMGNSGVEPAPALTFGNGTLQNGADAVALFVGDASDFPNDTPVTTLNLIDAIVYDTNDTDDGALLVLLNAGQPQVNEGGDGNSAGDSNQRIPNGSGGARNTDTYTQIPPTPGVENLPPPPVMAEIFEIQGDGLTSPFDGGVVITDDNVVTCLAPNGFFMQTPTGRADGDVNTSDGIFVFTGGTPGVAVGDLVDVTGDVVEFFGFTEFSNGPTVTIVGTGTVPDAVVFNAATPSPDPMTASCSANNFECFEGMLIEVSGGAVSGPNE